MKKAMLGFIASAMSLLATTAQAYNGVGDIRSIDPCDQYGYVIENGSMAQPYTAGQTAYFRIRLENVNSRESWETKDSTMLSNPWRFQYTGVGVDSALEWAINPPKVGVYVSGQLRGATVVSALPPADKGWYTDILCSYTVRPGDLALPMTLSNQAGKEMGDGSATEYYLDTIPRSGAWRLMAYERESSLTWDTVVATNTCTFKYGETQFFNVNASAAAEMNEWTTDYALKQAGLYLKSVDFTAAEYSVAQGRTEKVNVGIVGGVNTNGNGTVYAMVKDGDAIALAEDSVEFVTVAEDPNGDTDVAYQVAKVTIPSGADVDSFSFKVKGVTQGGESTVYLSTTKSFTYGDSHDLVTNFVTAVVKCVAPPPPYISVTLDGAASKSITSSANYVDYAAKLTVTLSEPHTSDVTVDVTPTLVSGAAIEPLGKYVGMSTYSENGFLENVSTVTFSAAEMEAGTLSKDLYVYALGADDQTDGIGKGILFKAAKVAIYNTENVSAILYIKKSTPQILYPTENTSKEEPSFPGLAGGVASAFTIKIADDYTNMQSPFKVEWFKTGSGTPQTFTVTPNSDGEATVSVRYNAGDYTTRFRVQNASGVWSDYRTITVQVNPAKQVSAVVEDPNDSGEYNETEEELTVRFKLTEAYEDSTLYAFLVPMDTVSSNLVVCKAFDTGIAIRSGDTESTGTAKIQLLDGTEETLPLTYSIVLRTEKTWDKGETIATYESKDLEIYINNVPPAVVAVNMSGSAPVSVNGGKFGGKASMGLNKIFTLDVEDVEADLEAPVTSVWTFSDPNGNAVTHTVVAPIDDIALTNVFEAAGVYTCTVKLQDKDMGKKKYGEVFTFLVEVLNTPSLSIVFPNSNTYNETDADKGLSYFWVDLSTPASKQIAVDITCTRVGANGVLNIADKTVSFRPGQVRQQILISDLDGTADSVSFKGGFSVTAKVVTEDKNEDGIAFKDVYLPATEKMYVANEAPVIIMPFFTGSTNDAPINVDIPLKWKVSDVDFDLNENLTITWTTSEGDLFETNGNDVAEGLFTTRFRSGGAKTVTMTVADKDGSSASVTLYYKVAASKQVYVFPMGPYYGGLTSLSKKYAQADGIGEGSALANGTRNTDGFIHTYTYGATIGSAKITARGYANGYEDKDINASGNAFKDGDAPYVYTDPQQRDSFFYAWMIAAKEDESTTYIGTPLISPVSPKAKGGSVSYILSLPIELGGDESNPMYADRFIEAYFAKELYPADNMGDINADRIPDFFATKYWTTPEGETLTVPEAMTGQAIAGASGEEGEGEAGTASDLAKITAYNGDLDFLPKAWTSANPLKPEGDFTPDQDFTTVKEIRGIGEGLNEPGVSEYDLTEAEKCALYAAYAIDNKVAAADYAAATNWATRTGWTPEALNTYSKARLNPLHPDTDGDGLDDGWEYYFWYYSKFGAITNGVWGRLEGRRCDFTAPSMSVRIAPEEIFEAFDPHVEREGGLDFDNDGLSDLEEYALGTNPCDWDSDGDGIADLYEVMNGLDPISPADALEGLDNPDCDFMARCDYAADTFTLYTFADGRVFALPSVTSPSIQFPEAEEGEESDASKYFKLEVGKAVYWVAEKPITWTQSEKLYLAKDETVAADLVIDGTSYLGEAKVLPAGTAVVVAEEAEAVAAVKCEGFSYRNPETQEKAVTKEALEVFNYGGDGVTYVPCTSNVTTYAAIPSDTAIVNVQTKKVLTLIHDQVYTQYGFDPRVAWNINENNFLDDRWREPDTDNGGSKGMAGVPTNTVAYTSRDEYLLIQYRMNTELGKVDVTPSVDYIKSNTTYPNLPVDFVRDLEYAYEPFTSTNKVYVQYWETLTKNVTIHGADTDDDGVPDGWELYVGTDPNFKTDRAGYDDDDKLNLVQEYAGVDSCNAYTNRFDKGGNLIYPEVYSITENHPGKKDGWWNKFFPTDPFNPDTDGDRLSDHQERDSWKDTFHVGNNSYGSTSFTFIYGENEAYAADGKSTCFRGGGLNPCTVDTDGDLLPDPWEWRYAGIVFANGTTKAAGLSSHDEAVLTSRDGMIGFHGADSAAEIRGGMDGTFWDPSSGGDAQWDFDHDGLLNFQEYLVQTLRHLRYDDSFTPLMGIDPTTQKFVEFLPFSAWDGNAFHKKCIEKGFTGSAAWKFRELGYFALPPCSWDPVALNETGLGVCANYAHSEGAGYRILLPPAVTIPGSDPVYASGGYACTDPRRHDTDQDGMDDYYEIFHGLNPLLGSAADPNVRNERGLYNWQDYDVIAGIYGIANMDGKHAITAWRNHWTGWDNSTQPALDAIRYPWMIGTMECDADGDGLRNDEESLKVNVAKPQNTHTDPTPAWMTDSTSRRFASFTSQYYGPDPYIKEVPEYVEMLTHPDLFNYPWDRIAWNVVVQDPGTSGQNLDWMFSFEENEGYDTDHDFKSDSSELVKGVEPTSDTQNFADPLRRQALYLPGKDSAAASYNADFRRTAGSEPDLFKQFTVECWLCPETADQNAVVIERVCKYGASTLSNNAEYIRANFRVGIENGYVYGEYEGSTIDSGRVRVMDGSRKLPANAWTHVAFVFDGDIAAIYVDGDHDAKDVQKGAGLLPANGIDGILQESGVGVLPYNGYRALPCAMIIGASALNAKAVELQPETQWNDYKADAFYKGWISEVRIWDGARSTQELSENYMSRYSMADVSALRENVYKAWKNGARRAKGDLPSELVMHYNFCSLPGGVESSNVIVEPNGFTKGVLDNVRKTNGWYLDLDEYLKIGWWSGLAVKSDVYTSEHVVPWIGNTVAHLPVMDGSAIDTHYWTSYSAGIFGVPYLSALDPKWVGTTHYDFRNSANPYSSYVYRHERIDHQRRLNASDLLHFVTVSAYEGYEASGSSEDYVRQRYEFQIRSDFVGTSDLIPLGGAFAKRATNFWDGKGAMDAWTLTVKDGEALNLTDAGIPDWAEDLGITTVEDYLNALSLGLLPSTTKDEYADMKEANENGERNEYADIADVTNDGLEDWWQRKYDLKGDGRSDTDKDGLADYAEYLAELLGLATNVNPTLSKTDGKEFDYFRKSGSLYLGEILSDHDFIEDEWENAYPNAIVDSAKYDPAADPDGDGWSNFAERRAGTLPDRTASITAEGLQLPDYPEPAITVKAYYNKAREVSAPIIVEAYSAMDSDSPDAQWNIPGSDTPIYYERQLGVNPGNKASYTLGPGVVVPGTVHVWFRDPQEVHVVDGAGVSMPASASQWREAMRESPIIGNNFEADISLGTHSIVGHIVYGTGAVDIDFTKLPQYRYETDVYTYYPPSTNTYIRTSLAQSYVKIGWQSKRLEDETKWQFLLSRADNGHVREGKNTFVAFVDLDNNGVYSAGEPMGIARDVDVGWSGTELEINITDDGLLAPRMALVAEESSSRGDDSEAIDMSHIYVYRTSINGYTKTTNGGIVDPLVIDREIGSRTYLTEADLLRDGDYEFDWLDFKTDVLNSPMVSKGNMNVTSVVYRLFYQPIANPTAATASNYVEIVRTFGKTHPVAIPSNANAVHYTARPVFRWRLNDADVDSVTAFSIRILDASNKAVWTSGIRTMPPRGVNGEYEWIAPAYVKDSLENAANYAWQISLHNAKFQDASWSDKVWFSMNVADPDVLENFSGSGAVNATVKYFGPAANIGKVYVEAFTTPDFTGDPAARASTNATGVSMSLIGLEPGTYYIRAFIDSDLDQKRSEWESWGYACPRGDVTTGGIYDPMRVIVSNGKVAKATVYIEDTDCDQDCLPDVWEYEAWKAATGTKPALDKFLTLKGANELVHENTISFKSSLVEKIEKLKMAGASAGLLSFGYNGVSSQAAALALGVPTLENYVEEGTLAIKSIALEGDNVNLIVGAAADEPAKGTIFVSDGKVTVTIVVSYADTLGGTWNSTELTKTFEIEDGAVVDTLTFSLSDLGLDSSKGFFKVELKK